MIEISFLSGQIFVVCGWILWRVLANRRKTVDWKSEAKQLLFLINLLVIYRVTFHPFSKVDGQVQPLIFEWAAAWPFRMNLVPLVNLLDYESKKDLLLNIIGNFALFIPTGIVTPILYRNLASLKKVTLTGFLISLTIEIIQLPFAVRASDVDDLILNTAGCLLGYALYRLFRRKENYHD
jgi:glycopeptide antibiotics resistance protein